MLGPSFGSGRFLCLGERVGGGQTRDGAQARPSPKAQTRDPEAHRFNRFARSESEANHL